VAEKKLRRNVWQRKAQLTGWPANKTANETLKAQLGTTNPGLCCFGAIPWGVKKAYSWGVEVDPKCLWTPDPPLWVQEISPAV
jgi:hypothetical protein